MAFTNEKDTSGFVDKLVNIGRVAKVVKGGRRFAFTAIVVVGDESGRVGWGSGKAREVPEAVRKATDVAKKRMVRVPLREGRTIHHNARGEFGGAQVFMKPATPGTGIIAGGPMRAVFESMGMKDVVAKSLGSSNPYNLIQATFEAFESMETPRAVAAKRGLKMNELRERREHTGFDFSQQNAQQTGTEQTEKQAEAQSENQQHTTTGKKTAGISGEKSAKSKQEKTKQSAAKETTTSQNTDKSTPSKTASASKDSADKNNNGNAATSTKATASKTTASNTGASKTKASASTKTTAKTTAEKSGTGQKKTTTTKSAEEKK